jgi:hypothetical protein
VGGADAGGSAVDDTAGEGGLAEGAGLAGGGVAAFGAADARVGGTNVSTGGGDGGRPRVPAKSSTTGG